MNTAPPSGATPILDRQKPFPAQVKSSGPGRIATFAAAAACGLAGAIVVESPEVRDALHDWLSTSLMRDVSDDVGGTTVIGLIVSATVAVFAGIVVHEAGHAIAGSLLGFHVSSIRVGRLQLDVPFRFSIYRGTGTGAGGWVTLLPVKRDRLALRAAAMLAAGPGANLLSAAALSVLPFSKSFGVQWFIFVSLALGTINLLPFRSRALLSDGRRILMLLRNRARGERWLAILQLVGDMAEGTPPESFSREYLALATAVLDNSSDTVTAHALAYAAAFHRGDNDEAARMLETALQFAGYAAPIVREGLMTDAAMFQGRRRRRADLAEAWRASLPAKTELPWLRDLADAGVLEARGEIAGALASLDRAEQQIREESNKMRREISLRSVERWRRDLRAQGAVS